VTPLTAEALYFRDRYALDAQIRQGLPYVVELERLDNGGNQFHAHLPPLKPGRPFTERAFATRAGTTVLCNTKQNACQTGSGSGFRQL
jgi:hypothetical protein